MVLLTWLATYPAITLVVWLLLPTLLEVLPLPVTTLVLSAIVVPLVSYGSLPVLVRRFGSWLRVDRATPPADTALAAARPAPRPTRRDAALAPATRS
ncbi:MAG: hypothetical protein ACON4Z_15260 [Planctomycetota bacterium]